MNSETIATLLLQLSVPDTETIKRAETELKPLLKNPACVPILLELVQHNDLNLRHTASTILRIRIKKLWKHLDQNYQEQVKTFLLKSISEESERVVRLMLASVIAIVAEGVFDSSQWNELLEFISQCYNQQNPEYRELTFILLNELRETVGDKLEESFQSLSSLFSTALNDAESKVKIAALTSGVRLMSCISVEQNALYFSNLFPQMVQVVQLCLQHGEDAIVIEVLDAFGDILQAPNSTINSHLPTFVPFILGIVSNSELEHSVRDSAILVLNTIAECKPKQLSKKGFVTPIITALMQILIDTEGSLRSALYQSGTILANIDETKNSTNKNHDNGDDEDEYDMDDDLASMATSCLDVMACNLPHKYFFKPIIEFCVQCMQQENVNAKKAGAATIGIIAEGCEIPLRGCLSDIIPFLIQTAHNPCSNVRECVCFALGQFAEFCQPDILHFHKEVLEVMFSFLDEPNSAIRILSCHVIEQFCQNLTPSSLSQFVEPLMTKFMEMLQNGGRSTQEIIISTISAIAFAAESNFIPYFQSTATIISELLFITDDELLTLRGRSLECMGSMALAVGFDSFQPFIDVCMKSAVQGIELEKLELQDFAYVFLGNLSIIAKDKFAPFLDGVVSHLLNVINERDTTPVIESDNERPFTGLNDSDDEDEDDDAPIILKFRIAVVDLKKNAIGTLGTIAENTGAAFEPYLNDTFNIIKSETDNLHDSIRAEITTICPSLITVSILAHPPSVPWEQQLTDLHTQTKSLCDAILEILIQLIQKDGDKKTVSNAIDSCHKTIELLGPLSLQLHGNALMDTILQVLKGTVSCQTLCDEGEEEEEEGDDHDEGLMENLADLIGLLPKVIGESCTPFIDTFIEHLFKYTSESRTSAERSMAVGCFATIFQNMKQPAIKYIPQILPIVQNLLVCDEISVKRNAAFCVGVMCEIGQENMTTYYPDFLQRLRPIFDLQCTTDSERGLVDNAAAAVARMIQTSPDAVPLTHVLPIFLNVLPFEGDLLEIPTMCNCLIFLLQLNSPQVSPHLPTIFKLFVWCLQDDSPIDDSIRTSILETIRSFATSSPNEFNTAIQQTDQQIQALLHQKLN